ncbi:MAG: response regulator transcription factor [Armatimonadota bacterium]|nr:response regulator transcription factor [Armatimonadota bacterium]MDR7451946.1 response regulator transcription factor [Armatimonadota bacterium]MDR7466628.1 response regulator transcription factor [Armatimonadota bacterium]MDR7492898.1 response regulator transcription factor [Armatimonadota bacterium]MDR7500425.1 response regulator transcription factor [Armatimonadota bacterium]
MTPIRILLVDDNSAYRRHLARLLAREQDFQVVGEAADGAEAIARARELRPDVVLMDFRMEGLDGFSAARAIVRDLPAAKVFILTAFPGALDPEKVARGGIHGLLTKDRPAADLVGTIRASVLPRA